MLIHGKLSARSNSQKYIMPQVDVREVGDALNSALKMLETMISNIQRFVPKVRQNERMELSPYFFFFFFTQ